MKQQNIFFNFLLTNFYKQEEGLPGRSAMSDLHISAFSTKKWKCRRSLVSSIMSPIDNVRSSFQGWLSQILWRLMWDPSHTKGRVMQSCAWKTPVYFENSIAEKAIYLKPTRNFIQEVFRIQCLKFLEELLFIPLRYSDRTTEPVFLSWGAALKSPLFSVFLMSNCLNWSHTAQYRSNLFLIYLNVCNKSVATVQLKCHFCSF